MSIQKDCVIHLRAAYRQQTGNKLGSGHAHEIVAAYFGYHSWSALLCEADYPLSNLPGANVLIPDLNLLDQRLQALDGPPADLPDADALAVSISAFLQSQGHFTGTLWLTRDLEDQIGIYINENPDLVEDRLSGQMAETNAYFDEVYVEEVVVNADHDSIVANISGELNGKSDPDRAFYGDKITFMVEMTFQREAGRTAYRKPKMVVSGHVDESAYYPDD